MSIKTETYLGIPFANNAGSIGRFEITNTNETDYPQKATFEEGFPAVTRISTSAGGKNPFGQDFNGMFFLTTSAIRELQAGKTLTYNDDFANAIGGYTVGAKVTGSDGLIYVCTTDGNTSDPTGLDGWQPFLSSATDSESETQAATSLAVKKAYDAGNNAKTSSIGYNQTWQNVTSEREGNVEYINTTGRPIFVQVNKGGYIDVAGEIIVDGVITGRVTGNDMTASCYAIVPNLSKYRYTLSNIAYWSELR